jgi:hypothetical protein
MTKLLYYGFFAIGVIGCASVSQGSGDDAIITLTRGGGLSGIAQTVRIWSSHGVSKSTLERSDKTGSLPVRLSQAALDSNFRVLDSLTQVAPDIPLDTGSIRHICADAMLTHIEFRRGRSIESIQEECPHRTSSSSAYWARVDSLFDVLAEAARR